MEQYAVTELAASADALLAGLGPVVAELMLLAEDAGRAVTLHAMEDLIAERGREILRRLLQRSLDRQGDAGPRLEEVTGADGVRRRPSGHGTRHMVTTLGTVSVERTAYRSRVPGAGSLFPRDAVLDLPACSYSWRLQRLAVMTARSSSFGLAGDLVLAATGVRVGNRQLEQITAAAAADADQFYQAIDPDPVLPGPDPVLPGPVPDVVPDGPALVMSADGKGVAMRPGSLRERTVAPGKRVKTFQKRRGTGEKGLKRMAETGCVADAVPVPRTPEQVMASHKDPGKGKAPEQVNRRYFIDIDAGRDVTIGRVFDEADRRDPARRRTRVALVDGDNYQLAQFQAQAARRGITLVILIDFIHVLGYLWKAAWCFHQDRDPAIEQWVITQALDILHGRTAEVITRISQLAAGHPPQRKEHARIIRKTLHYLRAKQEYLDSYPAALAAGWPIATGVIEGACRHLIQDRMGITGARWTTPGAQAILWLRAIWASGDEHAYWTWHTQQEHHRNHTSRYHSQLDLAA